MTKDQAWEMVALKRTDDNLRVAHDAPLELGHEEEAKLLLWFVGRKEWPNTYRMLEGGRETFWSDLSNRRREADSDCHHIFDGPVFRLLRGSKEAQQNNFQSMFRSYYSLPEALKAYKDAVEEAETNYFT